MNRKPILLIAYNVQQGAGGIENYLRTFIDQTRILGNDIHILSVFGDKDQKSGRKIQLPPYVRRYFIHIYIFLYLLIFASHFEKIYIGHLFLTPGVSFANFFLKKKYRLFVYGIEAWGGNMKSFSRYLKSCEEIISISRFTSNQIYKNQLNADISYLPPTFRTETSIEHFSHRSADQKTLKLLTVGRMSSSERYKGHRAVIYFYQK